MSDTPAVPSRPVLPSEMTEQVSLREFEQRLNSMDRTLSERIRSERELVESRSCALEKQLAERIRSEWTLAMAKASAIEKALDLQAQKYELRLIELNGAADTNRRNWRESLPRELFDSYKDEWQKWRADTSQSNALLMQKTSEIQSLQQRLTHMETALQQAVGALVLIRFMGFAGVLGLIVTFLRIARVLP